MQTDNIDFILFQFGVWCRADGNNLRYQSQMWAVMRELGEYPSHSGVIAISDELAMRVDACLSAFKRARELNTDAELIVSALILYYCSGANSYSAVAAALKVPRVRATELVQSGRAAVSAYLSMSCPKVQRIMDTASCAV